MSMIVVGLATLTSTTASAGTGGQTLYSSNQGGTSLLLATTCLSSGPTSCAGAANVQNWYTRSASSCTHHYVANDYYRNNVLPYNVVIHQNSLNCNRIVLYRNGTQSGAGAQSIVLIAGYGYYSGGQTYQSLSLSYS